MAKDYESYNNELAEGDGKNELFYNSNERHASIVLRALVKNAKRYIKIVCDSMCTDVSNNREYLDLLERFLQGSADRSIKILFVRYDSHFRDLPIAALLRKYNRQVEIRSREGVDVNFDGKPVHFTMADDKAFRIETDIKAKMAFGNFNNPEQASVLNRVFDRFFNQPETVAITL